MPTFSLVDDTVPVIWDTKHNTIVSNESSEIIRFLNTVSGDACCLYFLTAGVLISVLSSCYRDRPSMIRFPRRRPSSIFIRTSSRRRSTT
jgi:hypothetical protein